MVKSTVEKLLSGEFGIERTLEICVDCPMYRKYTPIDGNCVELVPKYLADRIPSNTKVYGTFRLPKAVPSNEYVVKPLCEYVNGPLFKPSSRKLTGIMCNYEKQKC